MFPSRGTPPPAPSSSIIVENIAFITSFPLVVLLRRGFGERFLTVYRLVICLLFLSAFAWLVGRPISFTFGPLTQFRTAAANAVEHVRDAAKSVANKTKKALTGKDAEPDTIVVLESHKGMTFFVIAFAMAAVVHLVNSFRRLYQPDAPHLLTYYSGEPWLVVWFGAAWEDWIKRFIEPGVCVLVGYFILPLIDPFLSLFVLGSALALFLAENLMYQRYRNMLLDIYDSHLLSQNLTVDASQRLRTGVRGMEFAHSLSPAAERAIVHELQRQTPVATAPRTPRRASSNDLSPELAAIAQQLEDDRGDAVARIEKRAGRHQLICPHCDARTGITTNDLGQRVACGGCHRPLQASFTVTAAAKTARTLHCNCPQCGEHLAPDASAQGQPIACTRCKTEFRVTPASVLSESQARAVQTSKRDRDMNFPVPVKYQCPHCRQETHSMREQIDHVVQCSLCGESLRLKREFLL